MCPLTTTPYAGSRLRHDVGVTAPVKSGASAGVGDRRGRRPAVPPSWSSSTSDFTPSLRQLVRRNLLAVCRLVEEVTFVMPAGFTMDGVPSRVMPTSRPSRRRPAGSCRARMIGVATGLVDDVRGEHRVLRTGEAVAVLAPSMGWQPPFWRRRSSATPSSNSWLPTLVTSRPSLFISSTTGSSWKAALTSGAPPTRSPGGDREAVAATPASAAARSCLTAVARYSTPPAGVPLTAAAASGGRVDRYRGSR